MANTFLVETIYPNDESGIINEHQTFDEALKDFDDIIASVEDDDGYDYVVINEINEESEYVGKAIKLHSFEQPKQ